MKKKLFVSICLLSIIGTTVAGSIYNKNTKKIAYHDDPLTGNVHSAVDSKSNNSNKLWEGYVANNKTSDVMTVAPQTDCFQENEISEPYFPGEKLPDTNSTFSRFNESQFTYAKKNPISTFSSDIDTASYVTLRQNANAGRVLSGFRTSNILLRTEEVLNYFKYNYKKPAKGETFGVTTETSICPWNKNNTLVHIGIKAKDIDVTKKAPLNLVFLIDVSGSMSDENKLPLLQKSISTLVKNLGENDTISLVTYADNTKVVLNKANGSNKKKITQAINALISGGGTNGGNGLQTAYKLAKQNYKKNYNNRIILATDGDFNFGMTSTEELNKYISKQRKKGIYLSVLGFGSSYNDAIMETLADNGNGNYNLIDSISEANRVLSSEFYGTMYTVAKDVKFQVTFDPKSVSQYRLIGYENRVMETSDFDNDEKDAGDMGAGQTVTIVYEIAGTTDGVSKDSVPIKLDIRYKEPLAKKSTKTSHNISTTVNESISSDMEFISLAIETVMVINQSRYLGNNSRGLSEIAHDMKYVNLNKSQKDFYKTLIQIIKNSSTYIDKELD